MIHHRLSSGDTRVQARTPTSVEDGSKSRSNSTLDRQEGN